MTTNQEFRAQTCAHCRWSQPGQWEMLECHATPPVPTMSGMSRTGVVVWPLVKHDDFCRAFEPQERPTGADAADDL